ncbi:hypothetical protein [Rhizobium rhizogenes]|uniref:hypothetical protein n=1 Tax=Rhizobium rhizogenes TaxID=359 RepID=UPI0022C4BA22|nr:hypothetical protein [Rhizobium rhizogenes]MCZ7488208.1 hypothetical protein [Rhizobium rhizogenes]
MNTSLQAPNRHIHDRSAIDAMTADWIAKHGEPRLFDQGACTHLDYIQRLMAGYGYTLLYRGHCFYTMQKTGDDRASRRLTRHQLFDKIDAVLIENGKQPFGWRK